MKKMRMHSQRIIASLRSDQGPIWEIYFCSSPNEMMKSGQIRERRIKNDRPVIGVRYHAVPIEHARNTLLRPVSVRQLGIHEKSDAPFNCLYHIRAGRRPRIRQNKRKQSPRGANDVSTFAVPVLLANATLIALPPATIFHLLRQQKAAAFFN